MILYKDIALKEFYNTIIMRMGKHRTEENSDYITIVNFINASIKETMKTTMMYKDWAYISTISVQHKTILPRNFVKPIRVLVSTNGEAPYKEARMADPKEIYTVTDWRDLYSWNRATKQNPIYTIWGDRQMSLSAQAMPSRLSIYLYPNTEYQTGTAPAGYIYHNYEVLGIMDCYLMPDNIFEDSDILSIPYEFIELVVLLTLARCLSKTTPINILTDIQQQVMVEQQRITSLFTKNRIAGKKQLTSYIEPVQPLVPPPPVQGEAPQVLV
jgi:hypothetical protein